MEDIIAIIELKKDERKNTELWKGTGSSAASGLQPHCTVHLNPHIFKLLKYSYSLYSYEQAEIVYYYSDKEKLRWEYNQSSNNEVEYDDWRFPCNLDRQN